MRKWVIAIQSQLKMILQIDQKVDLKVKVIQTTNSFLKKIKQIVMINLR